MREEKLLHKFNQKTPENIKKVYNYLLSVSFLYTSLFFPFFGVCDLFKFNVIDLFCVDKSYNNFLTFQKNYVSEDLSNEFELTREELETEEFDNLIGLFEETKILQKHKFVGKQHKLMDLLNSKTIDSDYGFPAKSFFNQLTSSLSLKYLNLIILLNSQTDSNKFLGLIGPIINRSYHTNGTVISNYLSYYRY